MTIKVEKVQVQEKSNTASTARIEKQQEQTFNYQLTDDDKNIGLKVESSDKKSQDTKAAEKKPAVNEPSTGKLIVNRTGAIILTPLAAAAGVLTLIVAAVNGAVNPNTSFNRSMTEGIKAAGQGADMLQKMWEGRYF